MNERVTEMDILTQRKWKTLNFCPSLKLMIMQEEIMTVRKKKR